jgi:hypothetical protein
MKTQQKKAKALQDEADAAKAERAVAMAGSKRRDDPADTDDTK